MAASETVSDADVAGHRALARLLEQPARPSPDDVLEAVLQWAAARGYRLYPPQEQAILDWLSGAHVILETPTGSGKSLVALVACVAAAARGGRAFWTAPVKALVNEKFFDLCSELGAERVGLATGDAVVNRDAPIVCCTAEILAQLALREGSAARVDAAVLDEFHYYGDRDRGAAWQIPLLELPQTQFLLMSATLGDTRAIATDLQERTGRPVRTIVGRERPVPLSFEYAEQPLHETVAGLVATGRAPLYVVHFTQRAAAEHAQSLLSIDLCSREHKRILADAIRGSAFDSPYGPTLRRLLLHGVGVHHAGMLPRHRRLVERLAQQGLLRVIAGTDTLGVGINVPIRTVVLTQLCKFDGARTRLLTAREFHQIAGRAGRKGFDERGWVVVQAPEHVIENRIAEARAAGDPHKLRKLVRKKPPERGYVPWDRTTFERLVTAPPERLVPRLEITHQMLLWLLDRPGDGCAAVKAFLRRTHSSPAGRRRNARIAIDYFRSLRDARVLEFPDPPDALGRRVRVRRDLQVDFSLHQTLSLYVVEAVALLDRGSPTYALDVLTLVEATLDDPEPILARQLEQARRERLEELRTAGVPYEERMAELEKVTPPRPLEAFLEQTFEAFAVRHPWVGRQALRPKSIARQMWEQAASFASYVRDLDLERVEGVLLRYLSEAYRAARETVPREFRDPHFEDVLEWLRATVRGVDASLLDEWEALRAGRIGPTAPREPEPDATSDPLADRRAFIALVRQECFRIVRALAARAVDRALAALSPGPGDRRTDRDALQAQLDAYFAEHGAIRLDADARAPHRLQIVERASRWLLVQTLCDEEGDDDGYALLELDVPRSREERRPVLVSLRVGTGVPELEITESDAPER
ncbi:MAG: DUF3516 domain-containing protein [Myxococcota bacterium]|nr:DUF3516 domain-containing protein [Myxococcota bacterium]